MRGALLAALLLVAVLPARGAEEQPDPLQEAMVRAEDLVLALDQASMRPDPSDWNRVRRSLRRLRFSLSGTPFLGGADAMGELLEEAAGESPERIPSETLWIVRRRVDHMLESMRALARLRLERPARPSPPSAEEAETWRGRLEAILDEESLRFEEEDKGLLERALEKVMETLTRVLAWLVGLSPDPTGTVVTTRLILSGLLMLLAFLMTRWLVRRVQRRRAAERRERPEKAVRLDDPARLWEEALRSAGRKEWDEAVRSGFLHVLAVLEQAGVVASERIRTNGEVLEDLIMARPAPEVLEAMGEANRLFDRVRYGHRPCDGPGWAGFRRAAETLVRGIDRERAA